MHRVAAEKEVVAHPLCGPKRSAPRRASLCSEGGSAPFASLTPEGIRGGLPSRATADPLHPPARFGQRASEGRSRRNPSRRTARRRVPISASSLRPPGRPSGRPSRSSSRGGRFLHGAAVPDRTLRPSQGRVLPLRRCLFAGMRRSCRRRAADPGTARRGFPPRSDNRLSTRPRAG